MARRPRCQAPKMSGAQDVRRPRCQAPKKSGEVFTEKSSFAISGVEDFNMIICIVVAWLPVINVK